MRSVTDVISGIKDALVHFEWTFVVEVVFFFLLIYFVLKILVENSAKTLIGIYVFMLLCVGTVCLFTADLGPQAFYLCTMLGSLFFLLLFSVEIKRTIWKTKSHAPVGIKEPKQASKVNMVRAQENIAEIVRAVQNLSKANIGALIVLSTGNLPREIIESGVALNSSISSQLIEGIFVPKAPLHDGAMIINGDKIQAAGCFLPLTQKEFPKDYGTRHRAGIGVTEVADVSTIIVSEETGIVSVVKKGEITRYVDSENLKRFLRDYYWKETDTEEQRV